MLSIPTSLCPLVSCVAAVLILPGLATPRGATAQSPPARAVGERAPSGPPLRSAVFPADTGRVRATDAGVFRALVDTVTSNELHGLRNPGPDSATYVVIRIDPHDLPIPGRR